MSRRVAVRRDQQGFASLVTVFVLIILLTLISLGFARLMSRTTTDSTNRQLGATATYAAQSGINDVVDYMKQFAQANPSNPYVSSPTCDSLIKNPTTGAKGPLYNDSNLSGNGNAEYSCILLNQTPPSLAYQNVSELKSQVIKVDTSAVTGALNSVMLSWQPSGNANNSPNYPPPTPQLLDDTTWNDSANQYMPMLRATIYPLPASGSLTDVQKNSKTIYLYPQAPDGSNNVLTKSYTALSDGQVLPVACGATQTGNFVGSADYRCNLIISGLTNAVTSPSTDPIGDFYLRLTPIYGALDLQVQADDVDNQQLNFIGDQAIVDVTAKVSNVSKRLQARVDISGETSNSTTAGDNISPDSNDIPEFALRSPDALCKQIILHNANNLGQYVSFDPSSSAICNNDGTVIKTPPPILNLSITGNDDADAGKNVKSTDNNPDSPQSPQQQGTVYIGSSATIDWSTSDTDACNASGDWSGEVLGSSTRTSTRDDVYFTGSSTQTGISSNVQNYTLTCTGPGGPSVSSKVTAWPIPTASISGPGSITAGDDYTINWSSSDAAVRCSLDGDWSDTSDTNTTDSETMNWPLDDTNDTKTFNVTCYDPISRASNTATWTVMAGGGCGDNCTQVIFPPEIDSFTFDDHDCGDGNSDYPSDNCYQWTGSNLAASGCFINLYDYANPALGNPGGVQVNVATGDDGGGAPVGNGPPGPYTGDDTGASLTCGSAGPVYVGTTMSSPPSGSGAVVVKFYHPGDAPGNLLGPVNPYFNNDNDTDFIFATTQDPGNSIPNNCRDGVHTFIACFDFAAYEGSSWSLSTGSQISYCDVNESGSDDNVNNTDDNAHWSRQGLWIFFTVGYTRDGGNPTTWALNSGYPLAPVLGPSSNFNFNQPITITCHSKDGGTSNTERVTSSSGNNTAPPSPGYQGLNVHWTTCADRGEYGTYFTDVASNGCN